VSRSITIHLAQPADCPSVVACVREAYQPYTARIGQQPAPIQANYAELIARREVYVLTEADEPVSTGPDAPVPTTTDAPAPTRTDEPAPSGTNPPVPTGTDAAGTLGASAPGNMVSGRRIDVLPMSGLLAVLVMRRVEHAVFIENVAVRPSHQGQGLGRRLMAFAEDAARAAGLTELRLYTNELMVENIAFYSRLGYVETGRRLDAGFRRVFMRKTLA
jgi:ribosomal protein S18 acetylase RimI-like enzyme